MIGGSRDLVPMKLANARDTSCRGGSLDFVHDVLVALGGPRAYQFHSRHLIGYNTGSVCVALAERHQLRGKGLYNGLFVT